MDWNELYKKWGSKSTPKRLYILLIGIIVLIVVSICVLVYFKIYASKTPEKCPISCDDNDPCTYDHCSESTNFECEHDWICPSSTVSTTTITDVTTRSTTTSTTTISTSSTSTTTGSTTISTSSTSTTVGTTTITSTSTTTVPEDYDCPNINKDGTIDQNDLDIISASWGNKNCFIDDCCTGYPDYDCDLNNDTNVNIVDIMKVSMNLNKDASELKNCDVTYISSCGTIISEPGNYILSNNLSFSGGRCIEIKTVSNVVLNCKGYSITGNFVDKEIAISLNNTSHVIVKNCVIQQAMQAIEVSLSGNTTITSNIISNVNYGIESFFLLNSTIENNNISDAYAYGITMYIGEKNIVSKNIIENVGVWGIYMTSDRSSVSSNKISGSGTLSGIIVDGDEITISNNIVDNNKEYGIECYSGISNIIRIGNSCTGNENGACSGCPIPPDCDSNNC